MRIQVLSKGVNAKLSAIFNTKERIPFGIAFA